VRRIDGAEADAGEDAGDTGEEGSERGFMQGRNGLPSRNSGRADDCAAQIARSPAPGHPL